MKYPTKSVKMIIMKPEVILFLVIDILFGMVCVTL